MAEEHETAVLSLKAQVADRDQQLENAAHRAHEVSAALAAQEAQLHDRTAEVTTLKQQLAGEQHLTCGPVLQKQQLQVLQVCGWGMGWTACFDSPGSLVVW